MSSGEKGEKEKESMIKNAGSKPLSRPPTRPSTPRDNQQLIDPLEELSESENAKKVEDILRAKGLNNKL